jgi:DNA-binding XRE family transcriptional regulator
MSLVAGPQLRAARAMAGMEQETLAKAAGVTAATVRRLEGMPGRLRATTTTVDSLQRALEAAGVEFTNGDRPGVRVRAPSAA